MFIHGFKRHFIRVLSTLLAALCLLSTASYGQDEETGAPPPAYSTTETGTTPSSIEQTLVPEGVLVMQLAEALKLGPVSNEAKAEELLSSLGIEPRNGWVSEYPVTPAVLGDIEKSIAVASDQVKIPFTKDQALKLIGDIKNRLGLDVNPGSNPPADLNKKTGNMTIYRYTDSKGITHITDEYDSIPNAYRKNVIKINQSTLNEHAVGTDGSATPVLESQYMATQDPEVINNYYYQQGPPVVTYFSPPYPYSYLYDWVSYPFWSTGFYFPGFFILNNFHRHVFFNRHSYFVSHHAGSGASFQAPGVGSANRALPGHLTPDRIATPHWFSTPRAQAGARAIVTFNQNRSQSINGSAVSRTDALRQPLSSAGHAGVQGNAPAVQNGRVTLHNDLLRPVPDSGERIYNRQIFNQRAYIPNSPRFSSPSISDHDRVFSGRRQFGESDSGRFHGDGTFREFHGGGNSSRYGGSSAGGSRGGGGHR
ncbi:hypothetical protein [Methylobacter sp.]|uniref:hypothetical protein n=1 Tax=Methylobacter sp. TaxID=2051955 RepID=UPI002FDCF4A5